MKIISHRCNLEGPDKIRENSIAAMRKCISMGYEVEVDIWFDRKDNKLYLGHDRPQHYIAWDEIASEKDHLWIHCKNIDALDVFTRSRVEFNYFWHDSDDFTLTSKNYIWTYPGKPYICRSVIVMPEWSCEIDRFGVLSENDCHGICTDYPVKLQKLVNHKAGK